MRLTSSEKMRDADSRAIHVAGVPSTLLMTNAAAHVAKAAAERLADNRSAVIFCGSGNNGGDGVGAAAYLLRRGVCVRCFLVGSREKLTPDTAEMERRLTELGGALEDFDPDDAEQLRAVQGAGVIIDAMFGIGLNSELRGRALSAVRLINKSAAPVIAADIASGVEADTGRILGEAVRAELAVTFSMAKVGHFVEPGCACCGELRVCDIGIPEELLKEAGTDVFAVQEGELSLPKRPKVSHKGDYGRMLILGGSVGYTGAAVMCAKAASRGGAGLVSLGVPQKAYGVIAAQLLEPMTFPLADDGEGRIDISALPSIIEKLSTAKVCVLGCGLGRSEGLKTLTAAILQSCAKQLVIDADGLFAIGSDAQLIRNAALPPVLTPHEGEFARLGGELTGDRIADARSFAVDRSCVLVLKGHHSICAFPDGEVYIIPKGNPGMAKGGSGDVLAGLIGALLCQLPLKQAVLAAVYIHASAGDSCAGRLGEYSMLPTDVIDEIPKVVIKMEGNNL